MSEQYDIIEKTLSEKGENEMNKLKKIAFLSVIIVLSVFILAFSATAENVGGKSPDGLSWDYEVESGILTISGTGFMLNYENVREVPWNNYRKNIRQVVINRGVRSIGMRAFYGCTLLTKVSLTDSVEAVYGAAFYNCTDLVKVEFEGDELYWERIKIGKYNDYFSSANLTYRATDHIHFYDKRETVEKATMKSNGKKVALCNICSKVYIYEEIPRISTVNVKDRYFDYTSKSINLSCIIKDKSGTTLLSGRDYKASFTEKTAAGKHKATITFIGDYAGNYSFYYYILPSAVSGLKSTSETDSITLSWDKVKGATGYRIFQYNTSAKKYEVLVRKTVGNSYTVKNLEKAKNYAFIVKAYIKTENGYFYSRQGAKIVTCTAVDKCKIAKISQTTESISFNWNKVKGATGYRVYVYDSSKNTYKKFVTTTALKYVHKNLKPTKVYTFAVKAYRKAGDNTVWGKAVAFSTATKPEKPSSLTAVPSVNIVRLNWKKNSSVTGYRIYSYNYTTKKYDPVKVITENKITLQNLRANKKYTFAVKPYVAIGDTVIWGDYAKISVRTEKDGINTVVVSASGSKYHKYGCSRGKNATEKVSVSTAIKRGYTACNYCF